LRGFDDQAARFARHRLHQYHPRLAVGLGVYRAEALRLQASCAERGEQRRRLDRGIHEAHARAAAREAALDALTQNIAAQGGFLPSIMVVADARYNTFRGEAVKLDLRPYPNVMVFPRGTVIATDTLDGGQTEDIVLKRLQAFLRERVRAVALSRGIIPTHDPQSGEPLVGQPIDSPAWLALVKQIQQAGPRARVTAAAAEDTYSADLLRLDLRVTSAEATSPTPAASATVQE